MRDKPIEESKYTELLPEFKGTYLKRYLIPEKRFKLGRVRTLTKEPRSTLSWHRDLNQDYIPTITNKGCRMVIEEVAKHAS